MLIARTGSQWRHLPNEYGKWNSVFRRYRRWIETGVFDAMLETLAESEGDIKRPKTYDWPGNMRELQNSLEWAVILARDDRLRLARKANRVPPSENRSFRTATGLRPLVPCAPA